MNNDRKITILEHVEQFDIKGDLGKRAVDEAFDFDSTWEELLDEREYKELDFAQRYARDYGHGTAGHNRLMLVAKIADILDIYEFIVDSLAQQVGRRG